MPLPQINLTGNLTTDPELRFLKDGTAVASLRVACNERVRQGDQWVDGDVTFVKVNVWRKAAENITQSLRKGDSVVVSGRLKQNSYTDQSGANRVSFEVEADQIGADLRRFEYRKVELNKTPEWGTSTF
jgi:single-strand DNA-binding protein